MCSDVIGNILREPKYWISCRKIFCNCRHDFVYVTSKVHKIFVWDIFDYLLVLHDHNHTICCQSMLHVTVLYF